MSDQQELSERELEILKLVATGVSNKEIAQRLYISTNTVKVHLKNIFNKIGVVSRTEAAMFAVKVGLIPEIVQLKEESENYLKEIEGQTKTIAPRNQWYRIVLFLVLIGISIGVGIYAFWQLNQAQTFAENNQNLPTPSPIPRWWEKASMITPRKNMAVVAYENQIYAIGGETVSGITNVVEKYDLTTDAWTTITPLPMPLSEASGVVIGGLIFIPGGKSADGKILKTLQVYDPHHDQWDELASLPTPLCGYAIAAYEGKLYLFGGWDGKKVVNTVLEYNPVSNKWTLKKQMPTARAYAGAASAGGKIFVVGGFDGEKGLKVNEGYFPDLDDGENNPWQVNAPLPEPRYAMGIASMADIIYVIGGYSTPTGNGSILQYFPQQNTWQAGEIPPMEFGSHLGMVPIGTEIFLLGGEKENESISGYFGFYKAIYTISIPFVNGQP